jgi:protein TonB
MMNEKKRRNAGVIGSALVHILIVLVISVTGLLHTSHVADDIVEVTFFGGGGGGGGGGNGSEIETAVEEETPAEETAAAEETVQNDSDAIFETAKENKPVKKAAPKPKAAVKSGTGTGTGRGSGNGSGTGPGSGSGSGGGHGSGHGTGTGSGYGEGNGVTSSPAIPPRIVKSYQPPYPSAERNAGIQGTVTIRFLIDQNGNVEDVAIINSSGNANLDSAAVSAGYKWRFSPAKSKTGNPVRCYANIPITFKIVN